MSTDAKIREVLLKGAERLIAIKQNEINYSTCESEIERVMLAAFMAAELNNKNRWPSYFVFSNALPEHGIKSLIDQCVLWINNAQSDCIVVPQVVVDCYRLDFLCVGLGADGKAVALAVECDGHQFHEKTKEQAQRDKFRDRYLLGLGIQSMRFTGSEIWRDALRCVQEIDGFFMNASYGKEVAA